MTSPDFERFFASLKLKNFTAKEFLIHCDRPGNALPPSMLWGNIGPTAIILQSLRDLFGKPIVITSCFRREPYNSYVGGGVRSQHRAFSAVDFAVAGVSPQLVGNTLKNWRNNLFRHPLILNEFPRVQLEDIPFRKLERVWADFKFKGGIGIYETFVHLDTRGSSPTWHGR